MFLHITLHRPGHTGPVQIDWHEIQGQRKFFEELVQILVFPVCSFLSHLGDKLLEGRATQTVIRFFFQAHDSSGLPPPRPELLGGSQEFKASPGPSKGSPSLNILHPATYITLLILSKKSQRPNTSCENCKGPLSLDVVFDGHPREKAELSE